MATREQGKIYIDGSSLADIEITPADATSFGLWTFLTHTVPWHPWIAGIAAIVGLVAFGKGQNPWVLLVAIVGVTLITIVSTWKWSSNGRTKTANELGHVRANTSENHGSKGEFGQRLAFGSDPPFCGTLGDSD